MESLISILIPCRNEEHFIGHCLESVLAFAMPAGFAIEILVLDGRSRDSTRAVVNEFAARDQRVRIHDNPGLIQSCALNAGIKVARGCWLMRLDAHAQYPVDYLAKCYATAVRTGAANVGGVCITEAGNNRYQAQLVQALTTHKFGVGNSGFRTGSREGSRDTVPFGFFRRDVFDAIGIFDERLVRAQDYELNCRIRASGRKVWLNPAIHSHYFNLPTLTAFYRKQFEKEAPYNAYLWYLAPYAFTPRHAITGVFALGVLCGLALAPFSDWIARAFGAVLALYALLAIASALQQSFRYRRPLHALCLPPCFFLFHFFHGLGLLTGLARLSTHTSPVQQSCEPWPGANRFRAWPATISKDETSLREERLRYNLRAQTATAAGRFDDLRNNGAEGVPIPLRAPYVAYHRELGALARPGLRILDICCGDGLHSLTGALAGADVHALDMAEEALKRATQRATLAGATIKTIHSQAEILPFSDRSIDLISCAGGLSYLNFEQFMSETLRVLAPDGVLICVDSFNSNVIYRFNRYLHYLGGKRSKATLERMPDERMLTRLRVMFSEVKVEYFGLLTFCLPVLGLLLSEESQAKFIAETDRILFPLRRYSFKILIRASRPRHQ